MYVKQPWAAENEANTSPLQKLTCLSVFELLLRYLSSEHSKHIQKNLWLRFFHSLHKLFEKNDFCTSVFQQMSILYSNFGKDLITKCSFAGVLRYKNYFFKKFMQ